MVDTLGALADAVSPVRLSAALVNELFKVMLWFDSLALRQRSAEEPNNGAAASRGAASGASDDLVSASAWAERNVPTRRATDSWAPAVLRNTYGSGGNGRSSAVRGGRSREASYAGTYYGPY